MLRSLLQFLLVLGLLPLLEACGIVPGALTAEQFLVVLFSILLAPVAGLPGLSHQQGLEDSGQALLHHQVH